MLNKNSKL